MKSLENRNQSNWSLIVSALTAFPELGGGFVYAEKVLRGLVSSTVLSEALFLIPEQGFLHDIVGRNVCRIPLGYGSSKRQRLKAWVRARLSAAMREARLIRAEVYFYPLTTRVLPIPRKGIVVTTFFDMQHRDLPQLFSPMQRIYRRVFYELAARRSDFIITISEFSASRISKVLNIPRETIFTIPLGVDHRFLQVKPSANSGRSYLLYPASASEHKNHRVLFEAFELLRAEFPELKLVLTGSSASKLGELPSNVEHKGIVCKDELLELYANAKLLVFPSRYEGFGLPVLEAMAAGVPVVCSDLEVLREVCGDDAEYFAPDSVDELAETLRRSLTTDLSNRIESARMRAESFTWDRCVEQHLEVIRKATALASNRAS